jgi:hypothetical protein
MAPRDIQRKVNTMELLLHKSGRSYQPEKISGGYGELHRLMLFIKFAPQLSNLVEQIVVTDAIAMRMGFGYKRRLRAGSTGYFFLCTR